MNHRIIALERFAASLLSCAGFDHDKAQTTARLLVLTDAMGRRTHGLAMLPLYLSEVEKGTLKTTGAPSVESDHGAAQVWDGNYLPGLWLVDQALNSAGERAMKFGLAAIAIKRAHHIGCLAALTRETAQRGLVALIANSDPSGKRVAPFGGTQALLTPNPIAFAYPTNGEPILIDTCASVTTTTMTRQKVARGESFEHAWLLDANGVPTTDPRVLEHADPRGSIQFVGGQDAGHKGFGFSLMIETLSQALSGHGRADAPTRWGGNVFVQVINPALFAGIAAFTQQTEFLANAARANKPIREDAPVRMPGDAAAANIAAAQREGIAYEDELWKTLVSVAQKVGVVLP